MLKKTHLFIFVLCSSLLLGACFPKPAVPAPATPATTSWYKDVDVDTYGNPVNTVVSTIKPDNTYVADKTDCDDTNASIHPGAVEVADDGIDNNCDGLSLKSCDYSTLETCLVDAACQWNGDISSCSKIPPAALCPYGVQAVCNADPNCQWDSANTICNVNPAVAQCEAHSSALECVNDAECLLNGDGSCSARPTDCASHTNATDCTGDSSCSWDGSACSLSGGGLG